MLRKEKTVFGVALNGWWLVSGTLLKIYWQNILSTERSFCVTFEILLKPISTEPRHPGVEWCVVYSVSMSSQREISFVTVSQKKSHCILCTPLAKFCLSSAALRAALKTGSSLARLPRWYFSCTRGYRKGNIADIHRLHPRLCSRAGRRTQNLAPSLPSRLNREITSRCTWRTAYTHACNARSRVSGVRI
jgi:hypothetical protein